MQRIGRNYVSLSSMRVLVAWVLATVIAGHVPAIAAEVGVASAVNTDAFGIPPGEARRTKVLGDEVIYNERIETSGTGLVQVLLVDGSTFTVGANSDLVIDEFVYDPNAGSGKLVATFGKGVARFVGGKLSKKRDGVTVRTPVGTIGIRGGIANLNLTANPPVFSLLFGKDLTFTSPDGRRSRIHKAGYSMEIGSGGTRIRRSTAADFGSVQTALTNGAQRGGAYISPTDGQIVRSGLSQVIAGLQSITPLPRPKPLSQIAGSLQETADALVQTQVLSQETSTEDLKDTETTATVTDDARILRAGTTFNGTPAQNLSPGSLGVVGGSSGFDAIVTFSQQPDTETSSYRLWTGTADGTQIYVFDPDSTVNEYFTQSVNANGDIIENYSTSTIPDAPSLDGTIVQNARGQRITGEGFGFFAHFIATEAGLDPAFNYGGTDYFYGLYGEATDIGAFDGSDNEKLRTYSLHGDILTAFQLAYVDENDDLQPATSSALFLNPSIAEDFGTGFLSSVKSSDLKVLEKSSDTLEGARYVAASMYISSGDNKQLSFVSVSLGDIENDNGTLVLSGERRGGHRTAATNSAALYGGQVESLEGGTGGTIFGSNGNYLVLGPGNLESGGTYTDGYVNVPSGITSTDQMSGTMHAAELSSETEISSLDRSSRSLTGYAAGALESSFNYGTPFVGPLVFGTATVGDFQVSFDGENSSLYATMTLDDVSDSDSEVNKYTFAFGEQSGSGQSVFVDADTFAAIETSGGTGNTVTNVTGDSISPKSGTTPNSYLIASSLVKDADAPLFSGKTKCTCDFLEWGYWGAKIETSDTSLSADRFDTFHIGTWVAGQVTNTADLPITGTATYAGHAVGNVVNSTAQYLAAGDFNMSLDFSTRSGSATIANFDDRTMSATITEQTVVNGNLFSGTLSGPPGLNGDLQTSVVTGPNGPDQGVIGDFHAVQGTWSATGIVAGEKQ